ncbi:lysine-specific demethylase 5D-like [Carica papaya]|uniref:lysine-specific demethylase 5D-like n=1 Tax=Carica papaya TaxID=3649 RepID=UPI000B8CE658|nr:lysine-specific demethylase 5D-like [Carica papaya]
MSPRKCPEYVGTEEDPTCIICQQYLYLSSIVCRCRPSAFVCLEHWEHLCECKPSKLRLLYRHTLAELLDLVSMVDKYCYETPQDNSLQKQISCPKELYTYRKKVKGGHATLAQLAEKWLSRSRKIIEHAFSSDDYTIQLEEAEQFLWAGSEMDPVRHVVKNLTEAKKWAAGIRNCISKVENWSCNSCDSEKVSLEYVNELLMWDPVPCNEPLHLKLKNHAEEARKLVQAIDGALLTCPSVSELELLYTKACGLPIYASEIGKLLQKISSAKVWIESAKECILDKRPGGVELDALYKLNLEIMELQVQLPETEMILDLLRQAESCRARCNEMLSVSINLKDVELLLLELDGFTVNIPELKLLKQYHNDTLSWISRFNNILVNVHEREDQENVVDELSCLIKDGTSLRIAVDELPLVEIELKKASCREKAQKARGVKTSLDFIQQLIAEAVILQIDGEKLFVDITGMLKTAIDWEERASNALACEAQMFDFEDLMRMSETIGVFLPSLDAVKDAVSVAKSWLKNSKPFIISASSIMPASSVQLEFEALKELVSQSKLLRISFEERQILEKVLKNCEEWEQNACSLLQEAKYLLDTGNVNDATNICLISEIESMLTRLQSTMRSGLSLGFNFRVILELQNAYAKLQWCNKVLSFCSTAPTLEDVETLMETAEHLSSTTFGCPLLWSSLVKGVKWLKRALGLVCPPCSFRISTLSEAEEVLAESKNIEISFQVVICQLQNAIQEHKLWQNQVDQFFSMKFEERSWSQILHIKDLSQYEGQSNFRTKILQEMWDSNLLILKDDISIKFHMCTESYLYIQTLPLSKIQLFIFYFSVIRDSHK